MSEANAICATEEKLVEYREIPGFPGSTDGSHGMRLGGLKGGPARAAKLSKERRSEIGRMGAEARTKNRQAKLDAQQRIVDTLN